MGEYREEDYLMLSGIQHFVFCRRQWALVHIENIWQDNYLTAMGNLLHEKAHNSALHEKRGNVITVRGVKVCSRRLGISGECDVIEFEKNINGVPLKNWSGVYLPYPIEYKRGESKETNCDRLQLCAQAICLEEMLACNIKEGALFYGAPKRREQVIFTSELREQVESICFQMHDLFAKKHTPIVKTGKHCKACSIAEQCLPKLCKQDIDVQKYLEDGLL